MNSRLFYFLIAAVSATFLFGIIFFYPKPLFAPEDPSKGELKQVQEKDVSPSQDISLPVVPIVTRASLLVVGDIMLDRTVFTHTKRANDFNHPFLLIDSLFQEPYDVRLANLEGPITDFTSVAETSRFTFTFHPNFVEPIKKRLDIVSLANNHTTNFGQKGLNQTRKRLSDAGVNFFGDPDNTAPFISTTSSLNGITFGFVGYHQLVEKGFDQVIFEIEKLDKEVDVVIVMPHWGVEYVTDKPSLLQKKEGVAMVDAGADIIFGAHPHVIQPIEIYKGKFIFYSFGNFIFDQYFSRETSEGLAVKVIFEKVEGVVTPYFELIPLTINKKSQPYVAVEADRARILQHLEKTFIGSTTTKAMVPTGSIRL